MNHISIKKGHNIRISGVPKAEISTSPGMKSAAIVPKSFRGVKPKLMVNEGDHVQIGSPLFFDKNKPDVRWASPLDGTVKTIEFGPRRIINKIEISYQGFKAIKGQAFTIEQLVNSNREMILNRILEANLFPVIRQRPFNKVPDPKKTPRDIFISAINTAPLSIDLQTVIDSYKNEFQAGITGLSRLTNGDVYVTSKKYIDIQNATVQTISGPHPAGNVGIQIHHTKPLKPNDLVWTVDAQHVITLGKLFLTGAYDPKITVSIGGPGASKPETITANVGANISSLIANQDLKGPLRLVSGDVLTGQRVEPNQFLGYYDSAVAILSDAVDRPFMGMLAIGSSESKYSLTNTFISFGKKLFNFNTSQNGEKRAMVPLNAWEKVLPMDIYPNQLYRSILAQDIEEMEQLGLWECDDEDFALCSFACPSKIDLGVIIRDGLDLLEVEG